MAQNNQRINTSLSNMPVSNGYNGMNYNNSSSFRQTSLPNYHDIRSNPVDSFNGRSIHGFANQQIGGTFVNPSIPRAPQALGNTFNRSNNVFTPMNRPSSGFDNQFQRGTDVQDRRRDSHSGNRNYAKIKTPVFDGSYDEWPLFKRMFLKVASLNHWGDEEIYFNLLNALDGEAKSYIISMERQLENLSCYQLMDMMEQRFGVGDRSAHFQTILEGKIWRKDDNLRMYQDDIRRLVSLAFPEVQGWTHQEILVKKYFINGIQEYQLKQRLLIDAPSTLEAAVQYCERFIAAKSAVDSSRKPHFSRDRVRMVRPAEDSDDEDDSDYSEEEEELFEDSVNFLKKRGFDVKRSRNRFEDKNRFSSRKSDIVCYKCGEKGHVSTKCQNKAQTKCYNCSGFGHMAAECPSPLNSHRSRQAGGLETKKSEDKISHSSKEEK